MSGTGRRSTLGRTLPASALPPSLVGNFLHRRQEIFEDAPRAEVDLDVDLHAAKDVQSKGTVRPVLYCSECPGEAEKLYDLEFHFFEARFRNPLFDVQDFNTHDLILVVVIEDVSRLHLLRIESVVNVGSDHAKFMQLQDFPTRE